jgi:hypothetical protein
MLFVWHTAEASHPLEKTTDSFHPKESISPGSWEREITSTPAAVRIGAQDAVDPLCGED